MGGCWLPVFGVVGSFFQSVVQSPGSVSQSFGPSVVRLFGGWPLEDFYEDDNNDVKDMEEDDDRTTADTHGGIPTWLDAFLARGGRF